MKTLVLDIETSPALADVWKLWDNNVSLSQLRQVTQVISFAARWHGRKPVEFRSDFHDGHDEMIRRAHELIDDADALVHYNGSSFDLPHLRREFILAGLTPPSPAKDIDLLRTVKRQFRFISNKLQHVSTELGLAGKEQHSGHSLWVACMAGDAKAWAKMRTYNKQDVVLTDELYTRLKPWLVSAPHRGLYGDADKPTCGRCGGTSLQKRGYAYTPTGQYQQWCCNECGGWSRGKKALASVDVRAV